MQPPAKEHSRSDIEEEMARGLEIGYATNAK